MDIKLTQEQEAKMQEQLDQGYFWNTVEYVHRVAGCSRQEAYKFVEEKAW